ncbi:hypothetical protein Nmel_011619 [Mimus melanotis]
MKLHLPFSPHVTVATGSFLLSMPSLFETISVETVIKEGMLMKQTSSFQRWKRRYFKLRGRTLYYAKTAKSIIFDEVDLTDASVAESSTKNVNNSFTVFFKLQFGGAHGVQKKKLLRSALQGECRAGEQQPTSTQLLRGSEQRRKRPGERKCWSKASMGEDRNWEKSQMEGQHELNLTCSTAERNKCQC